jgi:hypothetical protein
MPYYFEFKKHIFSYFSELKIRTSLKFEVLFFTLWKSKKNMQFQSSIVDNGRDYVLHYIGMSNIVRSCDA